MAFCAAVADAGAAEIRLAPGRGLIVPGFDAETCTALEAMAVALGFITNSADPRLAIAACAGAPFCASAHIATPRAGRGDRRSGAGIACRPYPSRLRMRQNAAPSPPPRISPCWAPRMAVFILPGDGRNCRCRATRRSRGGPLPLSGDWPIRNGRMSTRRARDPQPAES